MNIRTKTNELVFFMGRDLSLTDLQIQLDINTKSFTILFIKYFLSDTNCTKHRKKSSTYKPTISKQDDDI
ncbi:hypothetical protein BLOT_001407 [Blomia tropicalis]|nr:hypothetical protein BLOT_001407 [Blomia tropicalis]